ncbi:MULTISPECIES: hypothetical protein [unclassified Streptomyces]|uniref:hypothetical protein n=1 Tax=unclassified Streptomyces TaxID=2593676 RepID=UPI0027E3B5D8|nr:MULTISPECIES: hypothetical protein [unclassified Streptomyces]
MSPEEPRPAFVADVEQAADELVRAAEALYLGGTAYREMGPKGAVMNLDDGMFVYLIIPRSECVYIRPVTYL